MVCTGCTISHTVLLRRTRCRYDVSVKLNGDLLERSPFHLFVETDVISPLTTTFVEGAHAIQAVTGSKASFKIQSKDLHGNVVTKGGAQFSGILIAADDSTPSTSITFDDLGDGKYEGGMHPIAGAGQWTDGLRWVCDLQRRRLHATGLVGEGGEYERALCVMYLSPCAYLSRRCLSCRMYTRSSVNRRHGTRQCRRWRMGHVRPANT